MSPNSKQAPARRKWQVLLGCAAIAALLGVLFWVRGGAESLAQTPVAGQTAPRPALPPSPPVSEAYANRVVAYINDNIPITREELGEYLIARCGLERVENLVNKRIIEEACKARGIVVTAAEVEADYKETVAGLVLSPNEFVEQVLKVYKMNLHEWKEDRIRPKLLMTKLVQDRVTYTEEDISKGFEAYHGEKVAGRIILWGHDEYNLAMKEYPQIRDSEPAFADKAKHQASSQLASKGGLVDPIGHNTTGNLELEKAIFQLLPGDLTPVLHVPEGHVVFKCDKKIPAESGVSLQDPKVRENLVKEIVRKKTEIEIRKTFEELKRRPVPTSFWTATTRSTIPPLRPDRCCLPRWFPVLTERTDQAKAAVLSSSRSKTLRLHLSPLNSWGRHHLECGENRRTPNGA